MDQHRIIARCRAGWIALKGVGGYPGVLVGRCRQPLPEDVIVGLADGLARALEYGIERASGTSRTTRPVGTLSTPATAMPAR